MFVVRLFKFVVHSLTDVLFDFEQQILVGYKKTRSLVHYRNLVPLTPKALSQRRTGSSAVSSYFNCRMNMLCSLRIAQIERYNLRIDLSSSNDHEFISQQGGSFNVSHPGYQHFFSARVKFDAEQAIKEIDDIAITAYNAYGLPERVPDVDGLALDEALSVLDGYLQTELNRIPETQADYDWNSAEPQFIFKTKLASGLNDTIENMLERFTKPEDRVRLALLVFDRLGQDRASKKLPSTDTTRLLYEEVILKNMDNPLVMEENKKYDLQWSSYRHGGIVLNNSQTDAAKLWAVRKLVVNHSLMMGLNGSRHVSDELFESTLQNMKQAWILGLNQYSEETYADYPPGLTVRESQRLGNIVRNQMKQAQTRMSSQSHDKERGAKVQALIDSLTQESP